MRLRPLVRAVLLMPTMYYEQTAEKLTKEADRLSRQMKAQQGVSMDEKLRVQKTLRDAERAARSFAQMVGELPELVGKTAVNQTERPEETPGPTLGSKEDKEGKKKKKGKSREEEDERQTKVIVVGEKLEKVRPTHAAEDPSPRFRPRRQPRPSLLRRCWTRERRSCASASTRRSSVP